MNEQMSLIKKTLSVAAILGLSLFIVSCGGKDKETEPAAAPVPTAGTPPAPAAPGPAAPAPAPAPQGLSSFIEDASAGTAIGNDAASWNALTKRFRDNVTFYGNATVSSETALDYMIENASTSTVKFTRSNPQTLSNQSPTIQIQGSGDFISIQTPYSGSQTFGFQSQISLYGLVLKSTDVVGLYLSGDGSSLLKVQYNAKHPAINFYQIRNNGGYWNSIQVRITTKVINTSGTYIPQ